MVVNLFWFSLTRFVSVSFRFLNCGFSEANAWTMQEIYLNQVDKERIERIEFLDEANLLEQLLNHYSITVAYKGFKSEDEETIFGFV